MANLKLICWILFRVLLPLALLAASISRYNALSLIYCLSLLLAPLLHAPSCRSMAGATGNYLKALLILIILILLGHIVFQVVLIARLPYGSLILNCSDIERIVRHIGYQRLDRGSIGSAFRLVLPDVIMLIIVVIVLVNSIKLKRQRTENTELPSTTTRLKKRKTTTIFNVIGELFVVLFLAGAGIIYPTITSAIYFVVFLAVTSWWACYKKLGRPFIWIQFFLLIYTALHLIMIYLYQFESLQELVSQEDLYSRLFGLTSIVNSTCLTPNDLKFNDVPWPVIANPGMLLALYWVLATQIRRWLASPPEEELTSMSDATETTSTGSNYKKKRHKKSSSGDQHLLSDDGNKNYSTLRPASEHENQGVSTPSDSSFHASDEGPSVSILSSSPAAADKRLQTRNAFLTMLVYIGRQSYVAALIVMMAWSITYHSWMTFVLLIWACIIWIVPNPRRNCLFSSPVLVIYAIMLLIIQFIYGLQLNDEELPLQLNNVDFKEIGFYKYNYPCLPLGVKILYTVAFWLTFRQFMKERWEEKMKDNNDGVMLETVPGEGNTQQQINAKQEKGGKAVNDVTDSEWMKNLGVWIMGFLSKYWIFICAAILLVISLQGDVVLYRIGYMLFFLFFIILFQLSFRLWRAVMYCFWLTVIIYSMLVLLLIYTYQFDKFPLYWHNGTGMSYSLLSDIGLEQYDTGTLFLKLLTPTSFLIICILQVHYFHKDFLQMISIQAGRQRSMSVVCAVPPPSPEESETKQNLKVKDKLHLYFLYLWKKFRNVFDQISEILWRLMEIHVIKLALFTILMVCLTDVSAANVILVLLVIIGLPISALHTFISHCCNIWASLLILSKMVYQLKFVEERLWAINCTSVNQTTILPPPFDVEIKPAIWLGFAKVASVSYYVKGYIAIILVLTLQAIVKARQRHHRSVFQEPEPKPGIIFPEITRAEADIGLLEFGKFLVNYIFYKFGLEFCFIMTVVTVAVRMDAYAILYTLFLCILLTMNRKRLSTVWPMYVAVLAFLLPAQYLLCLGIPPALCQTYPWFSKMDEHLRDWLFLPDFIRPPNAVQLTADFFQLLFACCQLRVLFIESSLHGESHHGGDNKEILYETSVEEYKVNPVPDFITYTKSYLDTIKLIVFMYLYWLTLAIVFIAGTSRISLFGMGYLIGCFLFLWNGSELFLKPLRSLMKLWNILLAYNVLVILCKASLQVVGCVYINKLYCWMVHLLGLACLKREGIKLTIEHCSVPSDEAGLLWDGICFSFLLIQKRIFGSYYFKHVVNELEAQAALASRGADLINEILIKEVQEQDIHEREIVEKIKKKMDRIRRTQQKIRDNAYVEPVDHFEAIRSGDYYMFDEGSDEDSEMLELESTESHVFDDDESDRRKAMGPLQLLNSALKSGNIKAAVEEAKNVNDTSESDTARRDSEELPLDGSRPTSKQTSHSKVKRTTSKDSEGKTKEPRPSLSTVESEDEHILATQEIDDGSQVEDADQKVDSDSKKDKEVLETLGDKIWNSLVFAWIFICGLMDSLTTWLNLVSKDFRYVARQLAEEKRQLKDKMNAKPESLPIIQNVSETDGKEVVLVVESEKEKPGPSKNEQVELIRHESYDDLKSDSDRLIESLKEKEFTREQPSSVRLITALYYVMISRSELLCYFMIILNQMTSASILSLPLPCMAFLWGTLSVPRPTRTFWIVIITYTEAIVVIKYLFQFGFFPWNENPQVGPFWAPRILGIEKRDKYVAFDLALLLVIFFHRSILKGLGLWKDSEVKSSAGSLASSSSHSSLNKECEATETRALSDSGQPTSLEPVSETKKVVVMPPHRFEKFKGCCCTYFQAFPSFFHRLLYPIYRVTVDVYALMFICDFITFFIVVFGYWAFGSDSGGGGVAEYFQENKVPVPFLIMLIVQFILIIIDRALFLRKQILGKLIFQIVLIIFIHLWMFFILPKVSDREFTQNTPAQLWYFTKCVYFLLSAYQIRSGYPTRILGNFLTKKYNYMNLFLFKGFMAVPFLMELRCLMDWMWTDTSMSLSSWLKMEDIYANIFVLKCWRRAELEYPTPRGQKRKPVVKYGFGGFMLLIIILIIWFPLVLFSLADTVGVRDLPIDCTFQISIGGYQPIFKMSAQHQFIRPITEGEYYQITHSEKYKSDRDAQSFFNGYEAEDVIKVQINGDSTSIWGISPPSLEDMIKTLNNSMNSVTAKVNWQFTRAPSSSVSTSEALSDENTITLYPNTTTRSELVKMLQGKSSPGVLINNVFPKYVRIPSKGKASAPSVLLKRRQLDYVGVNFLLQRGAYTTINLTGEVEWWTVKEQHSLNSNYLEIYAFTDKVFPGGFSFLAGYGIMGLYVSLVLVVGRFVRMMFSGVSYRIMFEELPNVDKILQLCLDIFLVRESGELLLEEDLFAKLIFLYRSPETMIKWTKYKQP